MAGNGTSYAAAYVSGLDALLLSINPALDGVALRAIILETAADLGERGVDREYGAGRIHAARAVTRVRAAALAPTRDPRLPDVVFVPETQHTLRGRFRQFWEQHGG